MAKSSKRIVRAIIHPFLGVARIGNSREPDGWFIGPEVVEPPEHGIDFYRDGKGALKRQAARFRIFGLDADNRAVKELTADNAKIKWTVHLCNRKAQWYQFQVAQDLDEAKLMPPAMLRNITVADRNSLVIDPGPRTISGCNVSRAAHRFDNGKFMGRSVPLGELRTDDQGRLLVLGGHGLAGSTDKSLAHQSANNDGWFDDTSDGPITATIMVDGQTLEATAWVIVAPPNYAPTLKSVRTMWDRIEDIRSDQIQPPPPATNPSFSRDIWPIFQRLSMLQWVNAGFAATFGWRGPYDFAQSEWREKLSSRADSAKPLRVALYSQFRRPARDGISPTPWPWIYGDSLNVSPPTANVYATLGKLQMANLAKWSEGNFVDDHATPNKPIDCLERLPVAEQGAMLDRAAMEFCIADVFEPGIELAWIMRDSGTYEKYKAKEPYPRIRHAPAGWIEPSYGAYLDYADVRPAGQIPGGLTRWLAVPWQSDTASCLSGYRPATFGAWVPTLWPARVPNHIITESAYRLLIDPRSDEPTRARAFATRERWQEHASAVKFGEHVNEIVDNPAMLGLVVARPGPRQGDYPDKVYVEHRHTPR